MVFQKRLNDVHVGFLKVLRDNSVGQMQAILYIHFVQYMKLLMVCVFFIFRLYLWSHFIRLTGLYICFYLVPVCEQMDYKYVESYRALSLASRASTSVSLLLTVMAAVEGVWAAGGSTSTCLSLSTALNASLSSGRSLSVP